MGAVLVGVLLMGAAVFALLSPMEYGCGLGWAQDALRFLRGAAPVGGIFAGFISLLVGVENMRDRAPTRKLPERVDKGAEG